MARRGALGLVGGLLAMVWSGGDPGPAGSSRRRGRAGLPPPRLDQQYRPPTGGPPPSGGAAGTLRARELESVDPVTGDTVTIEQGSVQFRGGGVTYVEPGTILASSFSPHSLGFESPQLAGDNACVIELTGAFPTGYCAINEGPLQLQELPAALPVSVPVASGRLYVDSTGNLHYLGPGGTDTILAGP